MPSLTIENYVKTIYQSCGGQANETTSTGQLAQLMGVSPGTVTSMLKTLSETGLAEYTPYEGVRLTEAGRALALRVLRRHRLIELFLVKTLDLTWDEVHEEAEHMEHAVSDLLVDRIDAFLGYPSVDPHGDPIPRADLSVAMPPSRRLTELASGSSFTVVRVADQSPGFLRYLMDNGLVLRAKGEVIATSDEGGTLTVAVGDNRVTLSREVAAKLLVDSTGGDTFSR